MNRAAATATATVLTSKIVTLGKFVEESDAE
jgi:hypothetical protein